MKTGMSITGNLLAYSPKQEATYGPMLSISFK